MGPSVQSRSSCSALARTASILACALGVASLSGCELFDDLKGGSDVSLAVAQNHSEGGGASSGKAYQARHFVTDLGWDITLTHGWVTLHEAFIVRCDDNKTSFDMYWGQVPQDLIATDDGALAGVGATWASKGSYCALLVQYGPFDPAEADPAGGYMPSDEDVPGTTVLLRGLATRDDVSINFELSSAQSWTMVSTLTGDPLRIDRSESAPINMVITRQYDRLLDGIEFDDYVQEDVEAAFAEALMDGTTVYVTQTN